MGLKEEQEQKKKYLLATEEYEEMQIVKLTTDNIARVEAMIMTDSGYAKSGDVNAGPTYKKSGEEDYSGSTAYWMTKLRNALNNGNKENLESIVSHAVVAVDKENSTHINSDLVGRELLTKRIMKKMDTLVEILSNVKTGAEFINYIASETEEVDVDHKARTNLSFASKFCHYACFYIFDDHRKDNFSIYDNVLSKALPIYIKKYNLYGYDQSNYLSYYNCIGEIIKCSGESLSRNGFDHLIWYYYKARLDSIKSSKNKKVVVDKRNKDTSKCNFSTQDIYEYIVSLKNSASNNGQSEITVIARDVAHYFGRLDRIVMACSAMRKAMNTGDVIVYSPPKGNSTTLKIKYFLKKVCQKLEQVCQN